MHKCKCSYIARRITKCSKQKLQCYHKNNIIWNTSFHNELFCTAKNTCKCMTPEASYIQFINVCSNSYIKNKMNSTVGQTSSLLLQVIIPPSMGEASYTHQIWVPPITLEQTTSLLSLVTAVACQQTRCLLSPHHYGNKSCISPFF